MVIVEGPELDVGDLLEEALTSGDDGRLRAALVARSGPPGPLLDPRPVAAALAGAVGDVVRRGDPPVTRLEDLLDGWAALSDPEAAGDRPEVVLPCAAIAAYGEAAVARPAWLEAEVGKLRRAAADPRRRVRHEVAHALHRLLDAQPARTRAALVAWVQDENPLVVLGAVAAMYGEPVTATGAG